MKKYVKAFVHGLLNSLDYK